MLLLRGFGVESGTWLNQHHNREAKNILTVLFERMANKEKLLMKDKSKFTHDFADKFQSHAMFTPPSAKYVNVHRCPF